MPLTRITSPLISIPSNYPLTGSLNGTASYATTASFAMNGGSGGSGGSTSLTGITFPYVSGSNTYTLSQSAVAANDLLLSVNGVVQTPTTDYTVSASSVTFTDSYPSGSSVNVRYLVSATSSSYVNLNNIVLTGTTTGDAYYPQVAALLHFDGVNGSTVITDNSKNNLYVTASNGAAISTAQSKFGGASVLFDGTNDNLTIASNSVFDFGTNDFTIEFWVYFNALSTSRMLVERWTTGNANSWQIYWRSTGTSIAFLVGSSTILLQDSNTTRITTGQWYHIAVTRSSSTNRLFINGTQVASATDSTSLTNSLPLAIGTQTSTGTNYLNGYIDELRITNGYARYTSNFTTSSIAFADGGGDIGKALVVNSTATGVSIGTAGYLSSQLAKAWVNFNGTGTVAIRDSYNVSSITDNATGQYYVNFSTPMNNTNYAVFGLAANSISSFAADHGGGPDTVNRCFFSVYNAAFADNSITQVLVFSN
jgi:hypothetical protein